MQASINYEPLWEIGSQVADCIQEAEHAQDLYLEVKLAQIKYSSPNLKKYESKSNKTIVIINNQYDKKKFKFAANAEQKTYDIYLQNLTMSAKKKKAKLEEEDLIDLKFQEQSFVYQNSLKRWVVKQKHKLFERQKDLILKQRAFRCDLSDTKMHSQKAFDLLIDILAEDIPTKIVRTKKEKSFIFHDFKITLSRIIQIERQQLNWLLVEKAASINQTGQSQQGSQALLTQQIMAYINKKKLKADKFQIELRFLTAGLKHMQLLKKGERANYLGETLQKFIAFQNYQEEEDLSKLVQGLSISDN